MSKFIITYLGGKQPETPEQGQAHFAKYKAWLASIADVTVSAANPMKNTHSISPAGEVSAHSTSTMSGYTIIECESIEEAIAHAKRCPFLDVDGTLEVAELMSMTL